MFFCFRYGLTPHRGILLYGPPGTGKSTLARAAACEAGVPLFAINGPDVVSQFYGECEEALRAVFTAAEEAAPSVVLP
jgi:SpoVK/Ycf46/Vps4 family AAA+-type ATPase